MIRYALLNDLAKVHRATLLREAAKARTISGSARFGKLPSLLRVLLIVLA